MPQHAYFWVESKVDQSTEAVESLFDESIGTNISSTETSSHRANDTPSLSQLLEERTPSTQSVVTRVRFSSSFFELIESKMPMFGSTSGGKAGMSSASDQTGEGTSKGARPKEGADQGASSPDSHNDATSRESSPHWSPPGLQNTRDCFTLLFGVQVMPLLGNGTALLVLLPYVWNKRIITDTLSPSINGITQVIVLNPVECFVFKGHQSRGEGFSLEEATGIAAQLHGLYDHWIGQRICMHCVPHTLRDVRTELRIAKERWDEYWKAEHSTFACSQATLFSLVSGVKQGLHTAIRPIFCKSISVTGKEGVGSLWGEGVSTTRVSTNLDRCHQHLLVQCQGCLYARVDGSEHQQGHPLEWSRPDKVPQAFHEAFHSAWEEQSDSALEYVIEDSGDESDDIVVYDIEMSHHTMVVVRRDGRREIDTVPTAGTTRNDAMIHIIARRSWTFPFSGILHLIMP